MNTRDPLWTIYKFSRIKFAGRIPFFAVLAMRYAIIMSILFSIFAFFPVLFRDFDHALMIDRIIFPNLGKIHFALFLVYGRNVICG